MISRVKEFLKFAVVPLILLTFAAALYIAWGYFDGPSPDEFVQWAEKYYSVYGYKLVFLAALVEGMLFVNWYIPGSVVLVLGVLLAESSGMNVYLVVITIITGFFVTSVFNYLLGKYGWYHLFMALGLKEPLEKMHAKVEKRGLPIIFSTYFHPNLGALSATSVGILKLSFKKFLLYSLAALIVWNTLSAILIYFVGMPMIQFVGQVFNLMVGVLVVWLIVLIVKFLGNKRQDKN